MFIVSENAALTSRSNLLPNAFKWENYEKLMFWKTVEALVIILI